MPSKYFIPFSNALDGVRPDQLLGALTAWLDEGLGIAHHLSPKPYAASPASRGGRMTGLQMSTLTPAVAQFVERTGSRHVFWLGKARVPAQTPVLVSRHSWEDLALRRDTRWFVDFATPTVFRTNDRPTVLPTPGLVLSAAQRCWDAFADVQRVKLLGPEHEAMWVADLNLATSVQALRLGPRGADGRREFRDIPTLSGCATFRCVDPAVVCKVAPLFALANYSGMGSYRDRGFGAVTVAASP